MSELPEPLTPKHCDLRACAWMQLDVVRLRDSDLAGVECAEAFRCAVLLWCAAWHQVPAASLPDDEAALARLAGYGRDIKTFRVARAGGALRGWIKCSDGRLYHPVVAEKAIEAAKWQAAQTARTEAARRAKQLKREAMKEEPTGNSGSSVTEIVTASLTGVVTEPVTENVTTHVTGSNRTEQNRTELKKDIPPLSPPSGSTAPSAKRGCRLPLGWIVPIEGVEFAREQGMTPQQITATAAKFCDYWHGRAGAGAVKLDWLATWRNWVRTEQSMASPPSGFASRKAANDAYLARMMGEEGQEQPGLLIKTTMIEGMH